MKTPSSSTFSFSPRSVFTFGGVPCDEERQEVPAEDSYFTVGAVDRHDCAENDPGPPLTQQKPEDDDRGLLLSVEDELQRTQEMFRRLFFASGLGDGQSQAAVVPEDDSICTLWGLLEDDKTLLPSMMEEFACKSVEQWRGLILANTFFSSVGNTVRKIKVAQESSCGGAHTMHTVVSTLASMITAVFGDVSLSGDAVEKLSTSHLISQLKVQYPLWEDLMTLGSNCASRDIWAETRRQFRNSLGRSPFGQFILHKIQSSCDKSPNQPLPALMQALWKRWNAQSRELRAVYEQEAAAVAVLLSTSRVPSIGMATASGVAMESATPVCAVCGRSGAVAGVTLKKCGGCQRVRYCSAEHQKLDWKEHKKVCKASASSTAHAGAGTSSEKSAVAAHALQLPAVVSRLEASFMGAWEFGADTVALLCRLRSLIEQHYHAANPLNLGESHVQSLGEQVHMWTRLFAQKGFSEHKIEGACYRLWLVPGMRDFLLSEPLTSGTRRRLLQQRQQQQQQQQQVRRLSEEERSALAADCSAQQFAYLFFNLLLRSGIEGVKRSSFSSLDGVGSDVRGLHLKTGCLWRAVELWLDDSVRADCGDALAAAPSAVSTLIRAMTATVKKAVGGSRERAREGELGLWSNLLVKGLARVAVAEMLFASTEQCRTLLEEVPAEIWGKWGEKVGIAPGAEALLECVHVLFELQSTGRRQGVWRPSAKRYGMEGRAVRAGAGMDAAARSAVLLVAARMLKVINDADVPVVLARAAYYQHRSVCIQRRRAHSLYYMGYRLTAEFVQEAGGTIREREREAGACPEYDGGPDYRFGMLPLEQEGFWPPEPHTLFLGALLKKVMEDPAPLRLSEQKLAQWLGEEHERWLDAGKLCGVSLETTEGLVHQMCAGAAVCTLAPCGHVCVVPGHVPSFVSTPCPFCKEMVQQDSRAERC